MLRIIVLLLFIANLVFWSWTQGWLDNVVGVRSIGDREPERLQKQVRPESIKVLTPQAVEAVASEAEARLTCLESGPIAADQITSAQRALSTTLPGVAFASVKTDKPGSFLVYMGRYASTDALQKKREELSRTKLPFSEVTTPADLSPGFSLGAFETETAAEAALERFARNGVRTARVVQAAKPSSSYKLRVARADPEAAAKLFAIRSEALGGGFGGCVASAAESVSAPASAASASPGASSASVAPASKASAAAPSASAPRPASASR